MCMLELSLQFEYASAVLEKLEDAAMSACSGCVNGNLSQVDHSCLMLDKEEKLYFFFDDALLKLDEEEVVRKWKTNACKRYGNADGLVGLFSLKVLCRDYRETTMKTFGWRCNVLKMASVLLTTATTTTTTTII